MLMKNLSQYPHLKSATHSDLQDKSELLNPVNDCGYRSYDDNGPVLVVVVDIDHFGVDMHGPLPYAKISIQSYLYVEEGETLQSHSNCGYFVSDDTIFFDVTDKNGQTHHFLNTDEAVLIDNANYFEDPDDFTQLLESVAEFLNKHHFPRGIKVNVLQTAV